MGMLPGAGAATEPHVPASATAPHGVAVSMLLPGTQLTVDTTHSRYHIVVIDGCRVLASGGDLPEETEAVLVGAGDEGEQAGWIVRGLRLELWTSDARVLTSAVQSIAVVGCASRAASVE